MNYEVNYWVSKSILKKANDSDDEDKLSVVEHLWGAGHYANHFLHIIFSNLHNNAVK